MTAHHFETQLVLGAGSLANNAQLTEHDGEWTIQGDPTEAAFLVAAHKLEGTTAQMDRFERQAEIPFTSERKMMSTVHQERNDGTSLLFSKGAPDVLLGKLHQAPGRARRRSRSTEAARAERLAEVEELSAEAFRTLGVAYRVADAAGCRTSDVDDVGGARPRLRRGGRDHRPAAGRGGHGDRRGTPCRHPGHHDHRRPPDHREPHRGRPRHRRAGRPGRDRSRARHLRRPGAARRHP